MVFVGASIVFLTFIIREEVREDLKSSVDSITSAQTVFATRRDSTAISGQLNTLGVISSDLYATINGKTPARNRFFEAFSLRFRAFGIADYAGAQAATLDNVVRLWDQFGEDAAQSKRIGDLKNEILEFQKKCKEKAFGISPWEIETKSPRLADEAIGGFPITQIIEKSTDLSDELEKLTNDVLRQAEEAKRERGRDYKIVSWLSTGLFTLGWGLGLIAKLYGVEDAGQET
jgi:hypothetical protein